VLAQGAPNVVDSLAGDAITVTGELMRQYDLHDTAEADVAELAEELNSFGGF
jgi:hypothetical protein